MPLDRPACLDAAFAAVPFDDGGDVNPILAAVVAQLQAEGAAVAGVLQRFGERLPGGKRAVLLHDITTGEELRLDAPRGACTLACTLDADALARTACLLRRAIEARPMLLVANRFGSQEALGRGTRPELADAICAGIGVLIAVRRDRLPALAAFLGGRPHLLPARPATILAWARERRPTSAMRPSPLVETIAC